LGGPKPPRSSRQRPTRSPTSDHGHQHPQAPKTPVDAFTDHHGPNFIGPLHDATGSKPRATSDGTPTGAGWYLVSKCRNPGKLLRGDQTPGPRIGLLVFEDAPTPPRVSFSTCFMIDHPGHWHQVGNVRGFASATAGAIPSEVLRGRLQTSATARDYQRRVLVFSLSEEVAKELLDIGSKNLAT
jgi:hypothetical protein